MFNALDEKERDIVVGAMEEKKFQYKYYIYILLYI